MKSVLSACFVVALLLSPHGSAMAASNDTMSKSEFARTFCEILQIKGVEGGSYFEDVKPDEKNIRFINAMGFAFPAGHWDGKHWQAALDLPVTTEMVLKSFVIAKGFTLLDAVNSTVLVKKRIPEYGELGYSPDVETYIGTLLSLGVEKQYFPRNKKLSRDEAKWLLSGLNAKLKDKATPRVTASRPSVVSNRSMEVRQEYYQDGPIKNHLKVHTKVEKDDYLHQYASIKGDTEVHTKNVNYGIGLWGHAESHVAGAKMVGGFFTVGGLGEGVNSQIVGQEIDVFNRATTPDQAKKHSSVGIQIVAIGTANSTAAMQIISDRTSKWEHGLIFEEESISEDGTLIAVAQEKKMKLGLDFGNTEFSNAAIRLKNKQLIRFEPKDYKGNGATVFLDESGYFNITAGPKGVVVKSNDWQKNIVLINNNGDVVLEQGNLVMTSPGGKRFKVGVDDNGNLKTAKLP